jgi:hypothetical protein
VRESERERIMTGEMTGLNGEAEGIWAEAFLLYHKWMNSQSHDASLSPML